MSKIITVNPLKDVSWEQLLSNAAARDSHDGYSGNLMPLEAAAVLATHPNVCLVDVRTSAETFWVGGVAGAIEIEWAHYPGMEVNRHFLDELNAKCQKDQVILFLCRSGARSASAARIAISDGFLQCYNILEGFEGNIDEHGHRGTINGWRKAGLPWRQM